VCGQTIRNRLHEVGLRARRPLRCPALRIGNRARRLAWAREHVGWNPQQWSTVLFTDESRFGIHPDIRRLRFWRTPVRQSRLNSIQEIHFYQGDTGMVWARICTGDKTDLVIVNGFLNANQYVENIVLPVVVPFAHRVRENFTLTLFTRCSSRW
jgi:hypothetical protein